MTPVPTILTIADVERIAALAQLELTEEEKHLFTRQLADILAHAEKVEAIDPGGFPAPPHVNAAQRTERDDEPRPCLPVEEAIANAPDSAPDAGLFRVPRVIGGVLPSTFRRQHYEMTSRPAGCRRSRSAARRSIASRRSTRRSTHSTSSPAIALSPGPRRSTSVALP